MRVFLLFCTVISLNSIACSQAFADDSVLLAYHVEMEVEGGIFQLQQYGHRLSSSQPLVEPLGLGGKGKFKILLGSVNDNAGKLVIEYYGDEGTELSNALPVYSRDIDFTLGLPGEIKQSEGDLSIHFTYNVVEL